MQIGKKEAPNPGAIEGRVQRLVYNDRPVIERFVFVCGLHYSGTTLLERLLATRFKVSYLRARVPESEGQHMQSVYRAASHFGGPGRFAFSEEMTAELDALRGSPEQWRDQIVADWSRYVIGRSKTLLEKSPPNLTKIRWLRSVFPGCRFVIMSRDPRATSSATQKICEASLSELMRHWDVAYSRAMADYDGSDCTIIRYEDLCERPESELTRLAGFLSLHPRKSQRKADKRHRELVNSNDGYIGMHGENRYGPGIWDRFGYEV